MEISKYQELAHKAENIIDQFYNHERYDSQYKTKQIRLEADKRKKVLCYAIALLYEHDEGLTRRQIEELFSNNDILLKDLENLYPEEWTLEQRIRSFSGYLLRSEYEKYYYHLFDCRKNMTEAWKKIDSLNFHLRKEVREAMDGQVNQ